MHLVLRLLLCSAILPLAGCCTLSRLFCGPDTTPWVPIAFDTPEATVRTLLEAIRRDNPGRIYETLALEYKRRLGVEAISAEIAWKKIRDENTGIHLAGYAEVPPPTRVADDGASFELDVHGTRLRIELVREACWAVRYRRPNGTVGRFGATVTSLNSHARVEPQDRDEQISRVVLAPMTFTHEGMDDVPLEAIEQAGIVREWKVADLRVGDDP